MVALVGQPNSGKSAVLSRLTGARVVTSNYPGTTVELCSGLLPQSGHRILDTPGIYSLHAVTLEQKVTWDVLSGGGVDLVVNVVDGSNLARHLSLTLSLKDCGIPTIVAVNCIDRLRDTGWDVNAGRLEEFLGLPVVLTSAATGEGMLQLAGAILKTCGKPVKTCGKQVRAACSWPPEPPNLQELQRKASEIAKAALQPALAPEGIGRASRRPAGVFPNIHRADAIERALDHPLWAHLALGAVLAGAWMLMAWALPWAESGVRLLLSPLRMYLSRFLYAALPQSRLSPVLAESLAEGLVLPLATVLPAMAVTYSLMAFLEDTGLLARYAAMGDSLFGVVGLPGQALIPFMLGFGCRVPGLLAARILPSKRSRRAASVLIAALVPCTATVSLAWATLARFGGSPLVPCVALGVSAVALSKVLNMGGSSKDPLVLELPPLRLPAFRNVLMKTHLRLSGFFTHVLPLVVLLNVAIRIAVAGGVLPEGRISGLSRDVFGIPAQALLGVLLTMLQRYLAPLFLLQQSLTPREATIAVTMVVLGFPCLPSVVTLWREQGPGAVIATVLASTCLFTGWGALLNLVLP